MTPRLFYQGQLALAEGRLDEAIRLLQLALTRFEPGHPGVLRTARKLAEAFARRANSSRRLKCSKEKAAVGRPLQNDHLP